MSPASVRGHPHYLIANKGLNTDPQSLIFMTPEQFLNFARVLPEPLFLVKNTGEILSVNRATTTLLDQPSDKLIGQLLIGLVTDSEEKLSGYLRTCSQSRRMILGTLTFSNREGKDIPCRCQGAVVQPRSSENPAILLLRLEKRTGSKFIVLNQKIHALSKEILQRKRVQAELAQSNEALKQTLGKLQAALDAVQTEKMSGLGQLVAGIAHEINNPISFIHGNLPHAQEYCDDLLDLIHLYQQEYPEPSQVIQEKIDEIDFDFLEKDIENLLNSMQTGSNRVKEIVKSLRNFSRLDEAKFKQVDVHEGLEATLMLLQNRLQPSDCYSKIKIIKEYGELPLLLCSASALNQVFINILNNAIDALRDKEDKSDLAEAKQESYCIWIHTECPKEGKVNIHIRDNGSGIPSHLYQQIFDPFFTTKKVGQGTGLGLSITYQIIESHGGQISVDSTPKSGTKFSIELPISQF